MKWKGVIGNTAVIVIALSVLIGCTKEHRNGENDRDMKLINQVEIQEASNDTQEIEDKTEEDKMIDKETKDKETKDKQTKDKDTKDKQTKDKQTKDKETEGKETEDKDTKEVNKASVEIQEHGTYKASEEFVKTIGRTYLYNDVLWLSFSGAGIEFTFNSTLCEITLIGDSTTSKMYGRGHEARVAVYVNDTLVVDTLMDEKLKTFTLYEGEIMEGNVRVVKLSESSDSSVGIQDIKTDGTKIVPTNEKELKIEFIGDSITCGYGVDDGLDGKYSTANEDVTKAYAYKTAAKLNADYSMVSFSGYGILSGYTDKGQINTSSILPPYYDKLGKPYGKFSAVVSLEDVVWDFNKFIPDIVVINLGTNDYSYCGSDKGKGEAYAGAYVEFLKTVRDKNKDAYIICSLGIMGYGLYPYVENAVAKYQEETRDIHISAFQFAQQLATDGYAVDWHPSEITHEKAANQLVAYMKESKLVK